ncbi:MAG: tetratricopeptide repeat protein [Leptospirales bacterium]
MGQSGFSVRKRVLSKTWKSLVVGTLLLFPVSILHAGRVYPKDASLPVAGGAHQRAPRMIGEDALMYKKAERLFSEKNWEGAKGELKGLLMTHPESVLSGPSYLLLGRIAGRMAERPGLGSREKNEAYRQAIRLYWKAQYAPPAHWDRGRVAYRMGRIMFRREFYPEAKGYLEMGLGESPDGPRAFESHLLLAEIFRLEHHVGRSRQILDRLLARMNPQSPDAQSQKISFDYELARVSLDQDQMEEAGSRLTEALSLDGNYPYKHPELFFLLGEYSDRVGHNRRAFALYRNLLRFAPDSADVPEARYRMAILSGRLGKKKSMDARLMELIHESPDSDWAIRARLKLAESYGSRFATEKGPEKSHRKSDLDHMIDRLESVNLERGSIQSRVLALSLIAPLLADRNQWPQALRKLHRISSLVAPQSPSGKRVAGLEKGLVTGWILSESHAHHPGKVLRIAQSYRYALSPSLVDPNPTVFEQETLRHAPLVFVRIGKAQEELKHLNQAERWYLKALSVAPLKERPAVLENLFNLALLRKKPSEAYRTGLDLMAILSADPVARPVWLGRMARLARRMGKTSEETSFLEDRLSQFPEDESSGRSLARLFEIESRRGEYQKALETALRSRGFLDGSQDPRDRKALLTLLYDWGKMEKELHHVNRSRRIWTEFVKEGPEDPRSGWVSYQLGNLAETMGDPEQAYRWFLRASKSKSPSPLAEVARQRARGIKLAGEVHDRGF